jgi:hypothetical protein
MNNVKRSIEDRGPAIRDAAQLLIGFVRSTESAEGGRSTKAELELHVELTAGGTETWTITIERTASSH